jgi:hypothetical protein
MRTFAFFSILLAAFLSFSGCSKDTSSGGGSGSGGGSNTPGVINLTSPGAGVIVTNGTTLTVTGDLTDVDGLSQGRVELRNKNTNSVYFQQISGTGGVTFYRFLWSWVVSGITTLTPATLKITCVDRNNNTITKEIDIQLDN